MSSRATSDSPQTPPRGGTGGATGAAAAAEPGRRSARTRWLEGFLLALGAIAWFELSDVAAVVGDWAHSDWFARVRLISTYVVGVAFVLWLWERIWPVLRTPQFGIAFLLLGAVTWFRDPLLTTPMSWVGFASGDATVAPSELRTLRVPLQSQATPADLAERLGFQPAGGGLTPARAFQYVLPDGWQELTPSEFRWINLKADDAECYVTLLPGGGGGLLDNVNRWRGQFGMPPLDDAALAALPRSPLLGSPAVLVEAAGTFQGAAEQALLGLIAQNKSGTLTVKMTGPRETLARHRDAFLAFTKSLSPSAELRAMAEGGPAAAQAKNQPPSQPPAGPGTGWNWEAPDTWRRGPERAMREVTFLIGDEPAAECWVSVLHGDAGGMLANINRWRSEVGQAPVGQLEEQPLQSVRVLGGDGVLVELTGQYQGRSGPRVEDAMMLGVAAALPDRMLFVKLVGRRDVVTNERARFLSFVQSLTEKR